MIRQKPIKQSIFTLEAPKYLQRCKISVNLHDNQEKSKIFFDFFVNGC